VKIVKAFRYRVYPTEQQIARLARWDSALRFLWNLALEQRRMGLARPRDERIFPSAFDQINELTELRACVDAKSRVSQSAFRCTGCGHTEHADLNAPKVLKQRYEARANRSGKPVEGITFKVTRRNRKRAGLRVSRFPLESSAL
jgi:hypothetical protein